MTICGHVTHVIYKDKSCVFDFIIIWSLDELNHNNQANLVLKVSINFRARKVKQLALFRQAIRVADSAMSIWSSHSLLSPSNGQIGRLFLTLSLFGHVVGTYF